VALPFKVEHTVHHVLQHLGAGNRTLLVHMANDKDGDPLPFCQLHQRHGTLLDLADAARSGGHISVVQGLDGVHHQYARLDGVDRVDHVLQIGLREEMEPLSPHPQPLCP